MRKYRFLWLALPALLLAFPPGLSVGQGKMLPVKLAAPSLSVSEWIKGEPVDLQKGKGKSIYVIEFWATWCPPCRETIPHLTQLQQKFKDKGVVVVGLTGEDMETVKSFVADAGDKMDYAIGLDKNDETALAFDKIDPIPGIPSAYVVGKDGNVIWHGFPLDGLEQVLESLTGTPPPSAAAVAPPPTAPSKPKT